MSAALLSCLILSTCLVSANKIEKGFCSKLGRVKTTCKKTKVNFIGCNLSAIHWKHTSCLVILLLLHGKQKSVELPANPGLLENEPRISDSVSHPLTEAWRLGTLHSSPGTQTRKKKRKTHVINHALLAKMVASNVGR